MKEVSDLTGLIGYNIEQEMGVWEMEWFQDWESLVEHLLDEVEDLIDDDDRLEPLFNAIDAIQSLKDLKAGVPAIRALFAQNGWKSFWMGDVQDLMTGSSEVEKSFRKNYWEYSRQIQSDEAVPERLRDSFMAYCVDCTSNE